MKFYPATCDHGTWRDFLSRVRASGGTKAEAKDTWSYLKRCEYWRSEEYQVAIDKTPEHGLGEHIELWHLSFKRNDREAFHDWRIAQEIKNQLCGPEAEGVELYPAESRLVDTSNQYHLWVIVSAHRFPFGWTDRCVLNDDDNKLCQIAPEAKQRKLT